MLSTQLLDVVFVPLAQVAAEEARGLISDLRSDTLDRPLGDALERYVREWSERNGIAARLQADGVDLPHPGTRYELFCIVREALENVERHAGATQVQVLLRDWRPTSSSRWSTTASGSAARATRARCRPTATTASSGWPSAASGSARRCGSPAGTAREPRSPSACRPATSAPPEPWALEEAVE